MSEKKLIVFDWDGTLMDSLARIAECMQSAAMDLGIEPASAEQVKSIVGLALEIAIQRLHPELADVDVEQMRQRYSHHYIAAESTPSSFYAGALEMLHLLGARDCLLSVATGKSRKGLTRVFSAHSVHALFASSRCADETRSKPEPDMLLELMAYHGVKPSQTVMVGDTAFDLEMAQRAGVDSIGVAWGAHPVERLIKYQPRICANSVTELKSWLIRNTTL